MDGDCVTAPSEREGYVQLYDGLLDVYHELTQEEFAQFMPSRSWRDTGHKALCPVSPQRHHRHPTFPSHFASLPVKST